MKKYLGIILTLAIAGTGIYANDTFESAAYLRNISGMTRSFSESEAAMSIKNMNPEGLHFPVTRIARKRFFMIVPPNSGMRISVESASFRLYEKGIYKKTLTLGSPGQENLPNEKEIMTFQEYGQFRSWLFAGLDVMISRPLGGNPDSLVVLSHVDFSTQFDDPRPSDAPLREDPFGEKLLRSMTINSICASSWRAPEPDIMNKMQPYREFAARVNDALTTGSVIRLRVYKEGLYGVSGEELAKAGLAVESLDIRRLALWRGNSQVPIHVESVNNFLGNSGKIYFYALPFMDAQPDDVYFLMPDSGSMTPARIPVTQISDASRGVRSPGNIFDSTRSVRFMKRSNYYHRLPVPTFNDNWFWEEIPRGEYRYYSVNLDGVNPEGGDFTLKVFLAANHRRMDNYCTVFWNGRQVSAEKWNGLANHAPAFTLTGDQLKPGRNELALHVPAESAAAQSPSIYFIGFEIDYKSLLSDNHSLFPFKLEPAGESEDYFTLWFRREKQERIYLLDLTIPESPSVIQTTNEISLEREDFNFSASVRRDRDRNLMLFTWDKAMPVADMRLMKPLRLIAGESLPGDYLIVSHGRFLEAAKPLADLHAQRGYQPLIVDVEDIYDNFSFGRKDYEALKRFFQYRYYSAPGPALSCALLVGETSDHAGHPALLPPGGQEDLVPTWGHGKPMTIMIHADSQYTQICGSDELPDFMLGRFPVVTTEELAAVIAKTEKYLKSPPLGSWKNAHAFVCDDEKEFSEIAESVLVQLPFQTRLERIYLRYFPYTDLLLIWQRKTSPAAREKLFKTIEDGVLTVNYFGHGGPNLWSGERLLHLSDLPRLKNMDRLFFLTASTCDNSWLDYPMPPVTRSMGERMLLLENGGAIGVYGPTSGASPSDHRSLMREFYRGVFEQGLTGFGEAILFSKIAFRFERVNPRLLEQFVLLGDPSLAFPIPQETLSLAVQPNTLNVLKGGKVVIKGETKAKPFWGKARIHIQSPDPEKAPVEIVTHIHDGYFEAEHEIPPNAAPGFYRILAHVQNRFLGMEETGHVVLATGVPELSLSLDLDSSAKSMIHENDKVRVSARVKNMTSLPLADAVVRLWQVGLDQPIIERQLTFGPQQTLELDVEWLAESGVHTLRLEASAPGWQEGDDARLDRYVAVHSRTAANRLSLAPEEIRTQSEPLIGDSQPVFIVPFYNIGTQPFLELRAGLYAGGSLIGPPKVIKYMPSGERLELEYSSQASFPLGSLPIEVRFEALNTRTKQYDEIFKTMRVFEAVKPMDIIVVPDSISFESEEFRPGQTVFINALVKNTGGVEARNVLVQAFREKPWAMEYLLTPFYFQDGVTLDVLKPGEEKRVRLRWDGSQLPGQIRIFVVANSRKTIPEDDLENNVASASLEIQTHANLVLDRNTCTFSHNVIRKGDRVTVEFTIHNNSTVSAGTFDVEFESSSMNQKPRSIGTPMRVGGLDPAQSITLKTIWAVEPRDGQIPNRFSIQVNPTRMIAETLTHDNDAEFVFDTVQYLANMVSLGDNTYSFSGSIREGSATNIGVNPLRHLRPNSFSDLAGVLLDLSEGAIVREQKDLYEIEHREDDNKWFIKDKWLAASPHEDVPAINLSFPIPDSFITPMCDVYIHVQCLPSLEGYPATKVRLRVENEPSFHTWDFRVGKSAHPTQKFYIGRYDLVDRHLDVAVDDVDEKIWTIVNHFELVPIQAEYKSIVLELPNRHRNQSFTLDFDESPQSEAWIDYYFRTGRPDAEGQLIFEDWIPLNPGMPIGLDSDKRSHIQWKADFLGWKEDMPEIHDARIMLSR